VEADREGLVEDNGETVETEHDKTEEVPEIVPETELDIEEQEVKPEVEAETEPEKNGSTRRDWRTPEAETKPVETDLETEISEPSKKTATHKKQIQTVKKKKKAQTGP